MNIQQIKETLNKIPNGCFFAINYMTEVPLNATSKALGYKAYKVTRKIVRKGVAYNKMSSVIKKETERTAPKKEHKNPYEAVIPNSLYRHIDKDKYYLQVANSRKGQNTQSYFVVYDSSGATALQGNANEMQKACFAIPSYWNKSVERPEVQKIAIENITSFTCKTLKK